MATWNDADFLSSILTNALTACSAALTTASRPVARALIYPGLPVADCEQLATWPSLSYSLSGVSQLNEPIARRPQRVIMHVNLVLYRCISTGRNGKPPTAADIGADGVGYATDMWILQKAVTDGLRSGTIGVLGCPVGLVQPWLPTEAAGGFSSMSSVIEVGLS